MIRGVKIEKNFTSHSNIKWWRRKTCKRNWIRGLKRNMETFPPICFTKSCISAVNLLDVFPDDMN